jgi:Carboxypeptidase regulatory-like domain
MRTKRKRKKRIGTSLLLLVATLVPVVAAAKKKPALEPSAIISGSVFQESGYALPDATVTLVAESASGSATEKPQKMEADSDARGEFIFHVPTDHIRYNITVAAKGYQSLRKSVEVEGETRIEVTFQLERESK